MNFLVLEHDIYYKKLANVKHRLSSDLFLQITYTPGIPAQRSTEVEQKHPDSLERSPIIYIKKQHT